MSGILDALESAWLWTYTAGLPQEAADDRRAEINSDHWEYLSRHPNQRLERLGRLGRGVADDIAWRADFGREGWSKGRAHETLLLAAIAGFILVTIPSTVWWVIALAGNPGGAEFKLWYIASTAVSLGCVVVGGAASVAYYPRTGRILGLAGCLGMAATLWWTPVAFIVGAAGAATFVALPRRS